MNETDFFFGPIYLLILYLVIFSVRNFVTKSYTRRYFVPAITVKFIGAIALGLVYYFYYGAGDTTHYFYQSTIILQALKENFFDGLKLLTSSGGFDPETYKFASRMEWYGSKSEYPVIQLAAFFGMLTFGNYTAVALFYAIASFSGIWALYLTFMKLYPKLHKEFAIAILFLPSVFFWGSGIMKDTITLGALGWLFYGFYSLTIEKKNIISNLVIISISLFLIYNIKVYILLAFLPPALLWVFNENNTRIKNKLLRNLARPLFFVFGGGFAYLLAINLTAGDVRYDVTKLAERTEINNKYLSEQMESGSAYQIGTFDGSLPSILKVAPTAITVSLFRPFLWEVRSPIMLLSALESLIMLMLTLKIFFKIGFLNFFKLVGSQPIVLFCMIFSTIFAFAVGTNSGNFGTLVRYKIPLMPFYLSALFIMEAKVKESERIKKALKRLKQARV